MQRLGNFSKSSKRRLNVIIEDSESGFDLYRNFLINEFTDFDLNIIEKFGSDGKRLGGYNNVVNILSEIIDSNSKGDNLLIFDELLTYTNKVKLFGDIMSLDNKFTQKIYYFSPLCSESIIMQVLNFDEDENFNFIRRLSGNSNFYFNNIKYKIDVLNNKISLLMPNGEHLTGKTMEKILASYVSQITKKANIHCNKDKIDLTVSRWLHEKDNDLKRLKEFIVTGESSDYLLEGVI